MRKSPFGSPFDRGSRVACEPPPRAVNNRKDRARGPVTLFESILGGVVFAGVEFQFHLVTFQVDPEQEHVTIHRFHVAGSQDGGSLFEAEFVAVVEVDVGVIVPGAVTALDQRRTVERAQARQERDGKVGVLRSDPWPNRH